MRPQTIFKFAKASSPLQHTQLTHLHTMSDATSASQLTLAHAPAPREKEVEESLPDGLERLPEPPKDFHGVTHHKGRHYEVKVCNQRGYLAHVEMEAAFPGVEPLSVFCVLTNPNNAGVFRGVKDVGTRRLLESSHDGKLRTVEVDQVGEARFLWMTRHFHTVLRVQEDERDKLRPVMKFSLVKSDVLSAFDGSWHMFPLSEEEGQWEVPDGPQRPTARGVRIVMRQDVSPRGVPVFMKHLPLMGGLLRSGIQKAVCGVAEDLSCMMKLIQDGRSVGEALAEKRRRAGIKH